MNNNKNDKFDTFIKNNTEFKTQNSQAELDNIKSFIDRKSNTFNPFLPFITASSLMLVFIFIFVVKNTTSEITPHLEDTVAEAYLFDSYFAIEEDLESSDLDEDYPI